MPEIKNFDIREFQSEVLESIKLQLQIKDTRQRLEQLKEERRRLEMTKASIEHELRALKVRDRLLEKREVRSAKFRDKSCKSRTRPMRKSASR